MEFVFQPKYAGYLNLIEPCGRCPLSGSQGQALRASNEIVEPSTATAYWNERNTSTPKASSATARPHGVAAPPMRVLLTDEPRAVLREPKCTATWTRHLTKLILARSRTGALRCSGAKGVSVDFLVLPGAITFHLCLRTHVGDFCGCKIYILESRPF